MPLVTRTESDTTSRGRRVTPTAIAFVAGGALLAVSAMLRGAPFGWEQGLDDGLAPLHTHPLIELLELVTQLGAGPVLYPLLAVACWSTTSRDQRASTATWLPVALLAAGQALESVLLAPLLRLGPE